MSPLTRWVMAGLLVVGCGSEPEEPRAASSAGDEAVADPCADPDDERCFYDEGGRVCGDTRCPTSARARSADLPEEEPLAVASGEPRCRRGASGCVDGSPMTCMVDTDGCDVCTCDGRPRELRDDLPEPRSTTIVQGSMP